MYSAHQAVEMGLVNSVVPLSQLEQETVRRCRKILQSRPAVVFGISCALAELNGTPPAAGEYRTALLCSGDPD